MTNNAEKFLTQDDVAILWNISTNTLRKWRWEGKGPKFVKLGARVVYRESDVLAYAAANIKNSTAKEGVLPCYS